MTDYSLQIAQHYARRDEHRTRARELLRMGARGHAHIDEKVVEEAAKIATERIDAMRSLLANVSPHDWKIERRLTKPGCVEIYAEDYLSMLYKLAKLEALVETLAADRLERLMSSTASTPSTPDIEPGSSETP